MTNLNRVYAAINKENIPVYNYKIPFDTEAVTIEVDNKYGIFVDYDKLKSSDKEFIVLSHEYGHCKSGTTHHIDCDFNTKAKHEYKASRQSILTFLPVDKLKEAFAQGCQMAYEVAEYLDLPEQFIIMAIGHYRCMGEI